MTRTDRPAPALRPHPVVILAIDSGGKSGWGMLDQGAPAQPSGMLTWYGVATKARQKHEIVVGASQYAAAVGRPLVGVLEDWQGLNASKGKESKQGGKRMSTATILGMGANRGAWEHEMELVEAPSVRVYSNTWRNPLLGGHRRPDGDAWKRDAVVLVRHLFAVDVPHDAAEAILLGTYAARAAVVGELLAT